MSEVGAATKLPYQRIGRFYDALYAAKGRDPVAEVASLARYWQGDGRSAQEREILDVACGTGAHLEELGAHGSVEGLDRSADMLAIAREKCPELTVHEGDLTTFALGRRFDVVTCLFGGAGYLPDRAALRAGLATMGAHVAPGGILLIEPPIFRERLQAPRLERIEAPFEGGVLVREAKARVSDSHLEINFEWCHFDARGQLKKQVSERHRLLLLESAAWLEDARSALPASAEIAIDAVGLGRGLLSARFNPSDVPGSG